MDSFANRLMLARVHAGHLSIRDAADLCDLGRGAWTNWEKGAKPVDKQEIAAIIAEKLGVDYEWLLSGGQLLTPEPRRAPRGARGARAIAHYFAVPDRTTDHAARTARPRDNRPPGRPAPAGTGRTGYLPRGKGPERR